jgi:hypothetical protein
MSMKHLYRLLLSVICGVLLLTGIPRAQVPARKAAPKAARTVPSKPAKSKATLAMEEAAQAAREAEDPAVAESAALYREARYEPMNRRDPFLNPLLLKPKGGPTDEELPRGPAVPGIAGMYIGQVKLLGTSIGEESQVAVFEGTDKRVYFLRSGDRLYDGFLKSIGREAVVLVRETSFRSGNTTKEEITKRLRTP